MKTHCKDCRHWVDMLEVSYIEGVGQCRKRAPLILIKGNSNWPMTMNGDWCGEGSIALQRNKNEFENNNCK